MKNAIKRHPYLVLIEFLMLIKRRTVELGNEHDLTAMQTMTLLLLDKPRPMHSFKTIFNCDASNVTGIVDGLEQRKMVCRYEHARDRRIKMVKLDSTGRRVRNKIMHGIGGDENVIMSRLSSDEYEQFIGLVEKITDQTVVADTIRQ